MSADAKLLALQADLPPRPTPNGLYRPLLISGSLVYVSGHAPIRPDGSRITGRLGADMDVAAGKAAARQCGLTILSSLHHGLGSIDRIRRVVKILGFVNATPDFQQHPLVINGCSELFAEIFGPENGVGVRSAAGMSSLPGHIAVEIEAVFEIG